MAESTSVGRLKYRSGHLNEFDFTKEKELLSYCFFIIVHGNHVIAAAYRELNKTYPT